MKRAKLKKGQIVQNKGELNTKVYVVQSGLLRSYKIDRKGKEHIFMFAPEGWILADSVPPDVPCELFIDAIEDSEVVIIEKLHEDKPDVNQMIKRIGVLQKRVLMLMSASIIERYEDFIDTYPDIVQRVPQKMIASYLGVTPEALSKVKGEQVKMKRPTANRKS